MRSGLHRKTLAALAAGLAGVVAQAALSAIAGPVVVATVCAVATALAVHFVPNVIFGADVNEVAAATMEAAMEIGWDLSNGEDDAERSHEGG